jgi:heptosyltransferase-2/heptosyltransferase-3
VKSPAFHLSVNAASSPLNEWPLDDWAETLKQLWKKQPEIHVLATGAGSERESARLGDLQALVGDPRLKILSDRLTVARLAALLQMADLHLGLDSGVLHLAMALGKPTVSLFRESIGLPGWAPRGARHRVLLRPCPCQSSGRADCEGSRSKCLAEIKPDEVVEAGLGALRRQASRSI